MYKIDYGGRSKIVLYEITHRSLNVPPPYNLFNDKDTPHDHNLMCDHSAGTRACPSRGDCSLICFSCDAHPLVSPNYNSQLAP